MSRGRGRASGNPAGVVVQYRRASSSRVRPPTSTPSPRPMKGLHDLAPRRRRASEGSQAGGIRRFAARRALRGRLGSVLDVGKRRHRMRGRFHRQTHISTGPHRCVLLQSKSLKFSMLDLWAARRRRRGMRARAVVACSIMITKTHASVLAQPHVIICRENPFC